VRHLPIMWESTVISLEVEPCKNCPWSLTMAWVSFVALLTDSISSPVGSRGLARASIFRLCFYLYILHCLLFWAYVGTGSPARGLARSPAQNSFGSGTKNVDPLAGLGFGCAKWWNKEVARPVAHGPLAWRALKLLVGPRPSFFILGLSLARGWALKFLVGHGPSFFISAFL
jgi:hypothetical protein